VVYVHWDIDGVAKFINLNAYVLYTFSCFLRDGIYSPIGFSILSKTRSLLQQGNYVYLVIVFWSCSFFRVTIYMSENIINLIRDP